MLEMNFLGTNYEVRFHTNHYANNNNLYIGLYSKDEDDYWEPFADVTVNLPMKCKENHGFVDVNNLPGIEKFLRENKIAEPTGTLMPSGYCVYPEYEFNMDIINKNK